MKNCPEESNKKQFREDKPWGKAKSLDLRHCTGLHIKSPNKNDKLKNTLQMKFSPSKYLYLYTYIYLLWLQETFESPSKYFVC